MTLIKALLTLLFSFLLYWILPDHFSEASRRCAFIFIFAVGFWAFEIIPLFATSLLVVLGASFLLAKPDDVLALGEAGYRVFLVPFSNPVIMLFFGGLVLAIAIRKHGIDHYLIVHLMKRLGTGPRKILLGILFLSAFFSMWISNTASTALMLLLIQPILAGLPANDPFRKGLILAIPFGANIGGIGTPIGTPPNALAMGILAEHGVHLDFLSWMGMAVPLAFLLLLFAGALLILFFPPKTQAIEVHLEKSKELHRQSYGVIGVAILVIALWLTSHWTKIPEALTALLGIGLFSSFRLISVDDLKEVRWDILILMWGGLALGEAMKLSGLMSWLTSHDFAQMHGFFLIALFCLIAILLSSFISNTAAASLLLPIAMTFPEHQMLLLSITVALCCSFVFAFPISTPPNAMAYATGHLTTRDLFRVGSLLSLVSFLLVLAGFQLIILRFFSLG